MKKFFSKSPPSSDAGGSGRDEKNDENVLILEQLSKVSQDLANARMRAHEAEQRNSDLRTSNTELEAQVKSLQAQVSKIAKSFAFEEAEKTQKEVKELKILLKDEQKKGKDLDSRLKETCTRLSELEQISAKLQKEDVKLRSRIDEQLDEIRAKDEELRTLKEQCAEQEEHMKNLRGALQEEREHAAMESDRKLKQMETKSKEQLEEKENKIHRLEGERNNYMQKCKTLQKELQKVLKKYTGSEARTLRKENENLRAELERRSRSLQDALSALDSFAHTKSDGSGVNESRPQNHQIFTQQAEIKKLSKQLRKAEIQLHEKEMVISQLKSATHFFGEKIIELEDRSKSVSSPVKEKSRSPPPAAPVETKQAVLPNSSPINEGKDVSKSELLDTCGSDDLP
mmetsp:Transcript_11204/g.27548  ORF Transcript_11204/g.27548 Transcript_11204/m.27548 type:complete len:399 (-) Transcript_11204:436-1632(-)